MTLLCDYVTLCCLCEEPLDHVSIYRDADTGREATTREPLPHRCAEMKALMRERNA